MIYGQMKDVKNAITGPCYVGQDREVLKQMSKNKMAPLIAFMAKSDYLMGQNLTYLDFYMVELCDFVQWLTENEFYSENKGVATYVKRMKGLKQMKRYIKSDRFLEKPFNNKVAKINNM